MDGKRYIRGGAVEFTIETLSIDDLWFDPANPRIHSELEKSRHLSANELREKILEILNDKEKVGALKSAITDAGGPLEPLLVKPRSEGGYVVIEGNRRLAAYKTIIKEKEDADVGLIENLLTITCELYASISPEQEFALLNILHLRGRRKWSAFEKADYLYRQWEHFHRNIEEVAKLASERPSLVEKQIETVSFMKKHNADHTRYGFYYSIFANRGFRSVWYHDDRLLLRLHATISETLEQVEHSKPLTMVVFRSLITLLFKDRVATIEFRDRPKEGTTYALMLRAAATKASPYTRLQGHTEKLQEFVAWLAVNKEILDTVIEKCKEEEPDALEEAGAILEELGITLEEYTAAFVEGNSDRSAA